MKKFRAFVKKEFYHITRDWRTLIILLGMPIIQIMLFGFAITNEIKDAKIAILDLARDEHSTVLIDKILANDYFKLEAYLTHSREIEPVFRKGKVKEVIIFEPGFGARLEKEHSANIQIIADASDPNTATMLLNYTQAIIGNYQAEQNELQHLPFSIGIHSEMFYNNELKGVYLFVPGLIAIILMLVSAMMTSISITKEKELGTMEILLATPMKPAVIIIAKVIPYLILSFINAVIILLLGFFVFHVPVHGSLLLLLLEMILFILTVLSLGIFISTATSSQQVALMASLMGLMLPTILLSGFLFPVENMPLPLQLISNMVPAKWFIIIIKGIMLKGVGLAIVWKETLILVGFMAFFILLSVKKFKPRLA
ncbi:MAG: ABC transporter permease [Cyclobacteriaceae bacterium]|nr:ABC transporter permease [Cyclobacteriaceae bacterium]